MGPFIFPHPLEFKNWIPDMKKAEEMAKKAAEKYNGVFVPLHDLLNEAVIAGDYEKVTTDGTHLTEAGASIVAGKWLKAVQENGWL